MNIPFPDNTFDAIYAIEATCHAPNMVNNFTFFYVYIFGTTTSFSFCKTAGNLIIFTCYQKKSYALLL
jgi:hypothetical protein